MPYSRSWAFNVGARIARAPVLVLHDNDMLVPVDYAAQVLRRVAQGYEAANLKRFVFYLGQHDTGQFTAQNTALQNLTPDAIVQNLEGGGSVAITSSAYERIGGMNESFVGWGGEDNEFWERAQSLRLWQWGYLPILHLWHPPQPGKREPDSQTAKRYTALAQVDPATRIAGLRAQPRGLTEGPQGWSPTAQDTR
jgi:GT2 family glycosyltransferase